MAALTNAALARTRAVVGCAVHIKIYPRPRSITESREILRVLERYGEVVMFKNLKYEPHAPAPNSALAIYRKIEGAEQAITASPIQFKFGEVGSVKERGSGNTLYNQDKVDDNATTEAATSQELEKLNSSSKTNDGAEDYEAEPEEEQDDKDDAGLKTRADDLEQWQSIPNDFPTDAWDNPFSTFSSSSIAPATSQSANYGPPTRSSSPITGNPSASTPSQPPILPFPSPAFPHTPNQHSPHSPDTSHPRPCTLNINPSGLNHAAYIARQHYYGAYIPSTRTIPGSDLEFRVPLPAHVDLRLDKHEVPLRVRLKRAGEKKQGMRGLRALWEEGRRGKATEGAALVGERPFSESGHLKDGAKPLKMEERPKPMQREKARLAQVQDQVEWKPVVWTE